MKCDRCDNDATCHEVMIKGGKRHERHLCEACAKGEGMGASQPHIPITQLLNQFITAQAQGVQPTPTGVPSGTASGVCPGCGINLNQFRQTGLLGCPECYTTFEAQLSPLLQRAHEGGTHHVGKRPVRMRTPDGADAPTKPVARAEPSAPVPSPSRESNQARIEAIKARLAAAIAAERYEEAAGFRDELLKLSAGEAPAAKPARRASRTPRGPKGESDKGAAE